MLFRRSGGPKSRQRQLNKACGVVVRTVLGGQALQRDTRGDPRDAQPAQSADDANISNDTGVCSNADKAEELRSGVVGVERDVRVKEGGQGISKTQDGQVQLNGLVVKEVRLVFVEGEEEGDERCGTAHEGGGAGRPCQKLALLCRLAALSDFQTERCGGQSDMQSCPEACRQVVGRRSIGAEGWRPSEEGIDDGSCNDEQIAD